MPEHAARNMALERATGDFVTRLAQGECAHPMKIALQLEALLTTRDAPGIQATLARHVRMTPEGEALVGWSGEPEVLQGQSCQPDDRYGYAQRRRWMGCRNR